MNNMAISNPNNSPATRVNLLMMEHAPKIAIMMSKNDVQAQTLKIKHIYGTQIKTTNYEIYTQCIYTQIVYASLVTIQPMLSKVLTPNPVCIWQN